MTNLRRSYNLPLLAKGEKRSYWEERCWKSICDSRKIFNLGTKKERHSIVMRALVIQLLSEGATYKQIGEELFVSPQTISAIKKSLPEIVYKSYRGRGERKTKIATPIGKDKRYYVLRRTKYGSLRIRI